MKRAKLDDIKRRLHERKAKSAPLISSISVDGLTGFKDFKFEPDNGFLTFCGGTGSGKTSLLTIISALLYDHEDGIAPEQSSRFQGASAEIKLSFNEYDFTQKLALDSEGNGDLSGYAPDAFLITLPERTIDVQSALVGADLEILKEGVEPFDFEDEILDFIRFICRRHYDSVAVWEVESSDGIMMPFFEVRDGAVSYNSKSMGSGELSSFYLAWALRYLEPRSVIIIDEPEAYLPPASHEAVFSLIAHYAVAKKFVVVISTHSAEFASLVPPDSIYSIRREDGYRVVDPPSPSSTKALVRLGLKPKETSVIYVEDQLILDIVSEVIYSSELSSVCNFDICICVGGESAVKRALDATPSTLKHVSVFAVLDGDIQQVADKWNMPDRIAYLPFKKAPEEELLVLAQSEPAVVASFLCRGAARLHDALDQSEGLEHHGRFSLVAAYMGYSVQDFTKRAWQIWLQKPTGRAAGLKLAEDIARLSRTSLP